MSEIETGLIEARDTGLFKSAAPVPKVVYWYNVAIAGLRRWWKLALPLGLLLGSAAAVGIWLMHVPKYSAQATLRIKEAAPYVAFASRDNTRQFVRTQLQLFKTRAVLLPAWSQLASKSPLAVERVDDGDPVQWLKQNLNVGVVGGSELVLASFTDPDPALARDALAEVVDSYLLYHRSYEDEQNDDVVEALEVELGDREEKLIALQKQVQEQSKKVVASGASHLDSVRPDNAVATLQRHLVQSEVDVALFEANLKVARARLEGDFDVPPEAVQRAGDSDPEVIAVQIKIIDLKQQLTETESVMSRSQPPRKYEQMKRELARLEELLVSVRADVAKRVRAELADQMRQMQQQKVNELVAQIEGANATRQFLRERLSADEGSRGESGAEVAKLDFLKDELNRETNVYNRIAARITTLNTERAAPARVESVDAPVKPGKTNSKKILAMVFAAGFAGLFFPLLMAILGEHLASRITDVSNIEKEVDVIAEVATLPTYASAVFEGGNRQASLFEESIDSLGTSLRLSQELRDSQVISIVSAISGEGKTHLASQLAISLAKTSDRPVILVDGDFRSPGVADLLGLSNDQGLLDVLMGKCSFNEAVHKDIAKKMHVLPAGLAKSTPVISEHAVEILIAHLKERYRYVVFDTPPVLSASESLLFAAKSDVTLLCARHGYSRLSQIRQTYRRLARAQATPFGIVLNGVARRRYLYSYGSYSTA